MPKNHQEFTVDRPENTLPKEYAAALRIFRSSAIDDRLAFLDHLMQACDFGEIYHLRKRLRPRIDDVLTNLPAEISVQVLDHLDGTDLLIVRQVCKSWRRLADSPFLWKDKLFESYPWLRPPGSIGTNDDNLTEEDELHSKNAFKTYVSLVQRDLRWQRGTPRRTHVLEAGSDKVLALKVTPPQSPKTTGGYLISAGYDRHVRFWQFLNGRWQTWQEPIDVEMTMTCVDVDVATMTMACGGFAGICKVYRNGVLLWSIQGHASAITCLAICDNIVVTGGADHAVRVWDTETGARLNVFGMHQERVSGVAIVGDTVLSGSYDGTILCWDLQQGRFTKNIGPGQPVLDLTATAWLDGTSESGCPKKSTKAIVTYSTWQGLWRRVLDEEEDFLQAAQPTRRRLETRWGTMDVASSLDFRRRTGSRDKLDQSLQPLVYPWPKSACAYLAFSTQSRIISATSTQLVVWHQSGESSNALRLLSPTIISMNSSSDMSDLSHAADAAGAGAQENSRRDICAIDSNAGFLAVGCVDGSIKLLEFA